MFTLAYTGGTHNPALLILQSKGYELTILSSERCSHYVASANGRRFVATDAPELLGLVTIWENYGEEWNVQKPDIIDEILVIEPDK